MSLREKGRLSLHAGLARGGAGQPREGPHLISAGLPMIERTKEWGAFFEALESLGGDDQRRPPIADSLAGSFPWSSKTVTSASGQGSLR